MRRIILFMILPLCFALTACGGNENPERKTITAMDTVVTLTAYGDNAANVIDEAEEEIYRLDTELSRSNENGDIFPLNKNGTGDVSDETAYLINTAIEICNSTDGAFDITIAPVMDSWGFFGQNYRVPDENELREQLKKVNYKNIEIKDNNITLKDNAMLDLGGIAKGYASDKLTEIFKDNNIKSALISFGSAIQAIGKKPDGSRWLIGIADPKNSDNYIATLDLMDKCIATSGSYEQVFKENGQIYHHIIDPKTGYPANNGLASVSIICDNAAKADALSTALFVMGMEKAIEYYRDNGDFDVVFITDDNKIYYTSGIKESLSFLNEEDATELA
ncbi:MAG: FAD:protein FMN transferase [Oscillospiraceae bacterium]|nr:FAD:protein FMN transferase [Oscillospiraceae bacterium]